VGKIKSNKRIQLKGKIIETFERNGESFVKIYLEPSYLEISAKNLVHAHLGDNIQIKTLITIEEINVNFN
jgi:hypothetical protein